MALTKITSRILDSSGITILGTIATGVWQGTAINQTYLVGQSGTNTGDETLARINALDVTELGTISSGVWQGSVIAEAYLQNQSGTNTGDQTTISGNAGSVTNGVYTVGDQTIAGVKTFSGRANFNGNVNVVSANAEIWIGESTSGGGAGFLKWDDTNNYLYLGNSYGSAYNKNIVISSSGNVGIGTNDPSSLLSLGNAIDAQKLLLYDDSNNYKYGFGIQSAELRQFFPNSATAKMTFGTISDSDGTTYSPKLTITSGGNVGIGTTPSGYQTNGYVLRLHGGTQTYMAFNNNTHTTQVTGGMVIGNDANSAWIVQRENQPLIFSTNNANRLTITSGGLVKINPGTANNTSYDALVLAGGANSTSGSGAKMYLSGTANDPIARGTIIEGLMTDNANGHSLVFSTSSASAAPTERMRIQSDGDIKITGGGRILSSGGIYLGTNNNVNLLDAYEEGTWTGTMLNDGVGNTATGTYVRIGDLVYVQVYIANTTITSAGSAIVSGLPFSASVSTTKGYGIITYIHGNSILNCKGGYIANITINNTGDNSIGASTWVTGSGKYGMWSGSYRIN